MYVSCSPRFLFAVEGNSFFIQKNERTNEIKKESDIIFCFFHEETFSLSFSWSSFAEGKDNVNSYDWVYLLKVKRQLKAAFLQVVFEVKF